MADLLIKGMEMPKDCFHCHLYDMACDWCNALDDEILGFTCWEQRFDGCPLVAVEQVEQFQLDGGICWKEAR